MFCRNCGAEIPEGGGFCGSCGTPVKEEPVAVRDPEGSRPVMEGREREKKTDASSEVRKNNPDMEVQSKVRKPLIIGVCSGALLLAVGTAILFATGIFGGKDKPKEVIAEADEPEKAADLEEQQKEEMEEKPMEEEPKEDEPKEEEPKEDEPKEEESVEEEPDGEEPKQDVNKEEPKQDVNEEKEDTADLATGDYLCSDSFTRILTQEDVEKLQSGTYEALPEGKGIIQMAVNEMYAKRGYRFGNQSIQYFFDAKTWYRNTEEFVDSQESVYQNMSDIEQANVQFLSSFIEEQKVTKAYTADCYAVAAINQMDGVLTVIADGAPGSGLGTEDDVFSFSFPISEGCVWESGHDLYSEKRSVDYEEIREYVEKKRREYDGFVESGFDEGVMGDGSDCWWESPGELYIEVENSVVTRVCTFYP